MKADNVVVRFLTGKLLKGTVLDFNPPATTFHLSPADAGPQDEPVRVSINDLKAVFFVRDLVGDRHHNYRNQFQRHQPVLGRQVRVTFADGEVMVGWTMKFADGAQNFFLFPADTEGNTLRVFVVGANAKEIAFPEP